ncbi:FHA domain-containing protein [Nonomuraea roseola]|uniref:FHA domain-containing protein n=1 Tax=Nonomuraea roseola TaxID=46179 RepID=A0ABV5Q7H0_9ACTN
MAEQGFGVVRPLPGNGLVAHMGGLLLVCDTAEGTGGELLETLRESAESGADGLALARRAAQVLFRSMSGEPVACAVAGPAAGGMAVLVSGSASAVVVTDDGETRLSGRDSLTWTDRLIPGPVQRVELRLPDAGEAHPVVRLDAGVVIGGGVHGEVDENAQPPVRPQVRPLETSELPATGLHFEPDLLPGPPRQDPARHEPSRHEPSRHEPTGPEPSRQDAHQPVHEQPPPPPPTHSTPPPMAPYPMGAPSGPQAPFGQPPMPEPHPEPAPPMHQGPPPLQGPPGPHSGPMPPLGPPPGPMPPAGPPSYDEHPDFGPPPQEQQGEQQTDADGRPMVFGVDCKNDHFNDPRSPYCVICGIELVQRTLVPYKGPRPSLGALLLDDGTSLPLDSDYLLGRDPERAPEVAGGNARPAKVTSPDGSVSRRHLRVALEGWDVNLVDLGSVNGTQIQPPGDPNFYDIPPNEPVTIAPGTTVRIGVSRTMRYESHRN